MHELSRTPIIPDRAGQSGQLLFTMGVFEREAMARHTGRPLGIAQPSKADQAARRS